MADSLYVRIVGVHPHAGEYGRIPVSDNDTVTVEKLPGTDRKMTRVDLEDCRHGVRSCYVFPGQIQVIREKHRRAPAPEATQ